MGVDHDTVCDRRKPIKHRLAEAEGVEVEHDHLIGQDILPIQHSTREVKNVVFLYTAVFILSWLAKLQHFLCAQLEKIHLGYTQFILRKHQHHSLSHLQNSRLQQGPPLGKSGLNVLQKPEYNGQHSDNRRPGTPAWVNHIAAGCVPGSHLVYNHMDGMTSNIFTPDLSGSQPLLFC